ncbi:ParB/RepB/Spo0J family partition protein [Streptomyces naphthomycinicus]|uniref:ParB/RepB/Spo0J family partition protein n=1 Tax=Streptomyces naphthomycinicus TaxID=2872625 RepID=UPI001CEE0201|nr:ParB/RepB/Spo0J family partition protein [Streptomyces sp. TML10]
MGRRTSLATLAGAKVEDVPGRSDPVLLSLPLDKLHCTRFNPRRNFGTADELREFGEKLKKEQLQPAVVVSRAAYLKLWPDEADNVGSATYVIANGERRYRASKLVGLMVIEAVHREDVARSKADFLDAVQSENNDRKDLDPIERAIAIETMVTELGGADQVAAYYGKTKGWVSQQRKLLKLVPELQDLVSAGEMAVRVARDIAGLPPGEQAAAWQDTLEQRRLGKKSAAGLRAPTSAAPAPTPAEATPSQASPGTDVFTAVNQKPASAALSQEPETPSGSRFTAVNQSVDAESASTPVHDPTPVPGPRHDDAEEAPRTPAAPREEGQPRRLPYDDAPYVVQHMHVKMTSEDFVQGARVWMRILREQHPEEYQSLLHELRQQEEQSA